MKIPLAIFVFSSPLYFLLPVLLQRARDRMFRERGLYVRGLESFAQQAKSILSFRDSAEKILEYHVYPRRLRYLTARQTFLKWKRVIQCLDLPVILAMSCALMANLPGPAKTAALPLILQLRVLVPEMLGLFKLYFVYAQWRPAYDAVAEWHRQRRAACIAKSSRSVGRREGRDASPGSSRAANADSDVGDHSCDEPSCDESEEEHYDESGEDSPGREKDEKQTIRSS